VSGALRGDAVHRRHVDAIHAPFADLKPAHRDTRTGQSIQTGDDKLERDLIWRSFFRGIDYEELNRPAARFYFDTQLLT
jgi:hypothetical protein